MDISTLRSYNMLIYNLDKDKKGVKINFILWGERFIRNVVL